MNQNKCVLGLEFSTFGGRALLVRVSDGQEIATAVQNYASGVITDRLPNSPTQAKLPAGFALQDPKDYLDVLKTTIPTVLRNANIRPDDVVGIGACFTASTMLPVKSDGTPLCFLPQWRGNPHAWVKLWSHRSPAQAEKINAVARERGEEFLKRCSGRYSSGWLFSKLLEVVEKAPDVYEAADEFIEASDWIIWQLVGHSRRNNSAAGFKGMWLKDKGGYPRYDFFKALHPKLEKVLDQKLGNLDIYPIGTHAGGLSHKAAALTGLKEGTPVAVGIVDAHAAVPGCTVVEPGRLCMIMGARTCHVLLARERREIAGVGGVVEDGIIPAPPGQPSLWGYEAGQSGGGNILQWFLQQAAGGEVSLEADRRTLTVPQLLEERASALRPGQTGLLALDWWNGNHCVLMDSSVSGTIIGLTLETQPHEVYRALMESMAFGARKIVDSFTRAGLEVHELVASGCMSEGSQLVLQIFSDVTGRSVRVAESHQPAALGGAMYGAVAAGRAGGGYQTIQEAVRHMARTKTEIYRPRKAAQDVYAQLYAEFETLHDYFGRGANPVMKKLKRIQSGMV